jgi:hypothetical protein
MMIPDPTRQGQDAGLTRGSRVAADPQALARRPTIKLSAFELFDVKFTN